MGLPALLPPAPVASCQPVKLQPIKPHTVLPEQYTSRSKALMALKRVESVEVRESVKRNGHRFYVIDVYYKLIQSHIPTNHNYTAPAKRRQPDLRVERRLSEIVNLRDEIYYHAHNGHGNLPCQFCKSTVDYVLHGNAKPRVMLSLFDGQEQIHSTLTQFLSQILRLTSTVKAYGGNHCQGQDNIPVLVKLFLVPGAGDDELELTYD